MQDNESVWISQAQDGNSESFSRLVEMYQRPVYNLCYRMLNNPGDAEDAAQETFLRAFKAIKKYDRSRPFPTWLLSIAAHYCIDQMRKRRMTIISVDDLPYLEISDDSPGPEKLTTRYEEEQSIRKLLKTLNDTDRAAVVLYYWYDYSYDEIGKTLSLSLSAVKSRLHRARLNMAQEWNNQQAKAGIPERTQHDKVQSPAF